MQNITLNTLFTTEQVAKSYGISQNTIRDHLKNHSDEILENIHFVTHKNDRNRPIVKWTLKGIVVLGFFIRSKEAKNFRIWASNQLERELLKQAKDYKEARARNLALADKVNSLEACAIKDAKDHQDQINGYKSQISQHNAVIASLKTELAKRGKIYDAEVIERYEQKEESLRAQLHNAKAERDFYFKRTQELKQKQNIKDSEIVRILNKIQIQMDGVYSEIGAVMAYANDNDRFFIERNQILKG